MDLQTLKNQYAQEQDYVDWENLTFNSSAFERENQLTEFSKGRADEIADVLIKYSEN